MIIVAGSFVVAVEEREAFIASRVAAMERSRAEAGCIDYVFSADPIDPARVVLFERWEDKEALAAHLQAMRASRPSRPSAAASTATAAPAPAVIRSEIAQYEISAVGPVGS